VDPTKITNRILASVAFGLVALAVVFFFHVYMEVKTGYRFVLGPAEYVVIFASNGFLVFLLQVMTAGIKYEFARRFELQPLRFIIARIILIGVAWFVILLAMGVWTHFVSLGMSVLFFFSVIESFAYSLLKIWNFGR
jgi:hypothetical protein